MKLISVISPIYKVEGYLEKCVNSICNQTYENLEIILVDDGSPDCCGEICDRVARADGRIKVIHKANGGAASARNAGIEIATGEYLYFPDSDDWLEPSYIEELFQIAETTKAQLVVSGFTMEYFESGERKSYCVSVSDEVFYNRETVRENLQNYFDNMMMAVPWNKLYSAEYIKKNHLRFPDLKWDDLHFNMEVIKDIERVAISSSSGYHFFRSRPGSETTTVFDGNLFQKRKEQFEHILQVYNYWNTEDNHIFSILYGYYASRLVQCIQEISISPTCEKKEQIREILEDRLTKESFRHGRIQSKLLACVAIPMKCGSVTGSLVVGKIIGFVKVNMASTFHFLKSWSVNKARRSKKYIELGQINDEKISTYKN